MPETTIQLRHRPLPELHWTPAPRAALPVRTNGNLAQIQQGAPKGVRSRIGLNMVNGAFPYPRYVRTDGQVTWHDHDIVTIEHPRWRIEVAASLGGKVLSIYDKKLKAELLWNAPYLHNQQVSLAGAWGVGGLEFNCFRGGHQVFGQSRIRMDKVELPDGSLGISFGATDEWLGCSWNVILRATDQCVAYRVRLVNHSKQPRPGYWWTNIAAPVHNDSRVLMGPGPMLHHGSTEAGLADEQWPMVVGKDWSYWTNHTRVFSGYCHKLNSDYVGYSDVRNAIAMFHQADRRLLLGRKLWSVGAQYAGSIWAQACFELALCSYVEIQIGRLPTQLEADLIAPGQVLEWTERIGAVPWAAKGEYPAVFEEFSRECTAALSGAPDLDAPAAWVPKSTSPLCAAEPRLCLSQQIIADPTKVTPAEVEKTCREGWVAGEQWVGRLRSIPEKERSPWVRLALMAALMIDDALDESALDSSGAVDGQEPEAAAWTVFLRGVSERRKHGPAKARDWFAKAVKLYPAEPAFVLALSEALIAANDLSGVTALWSAALPGVAESDGGRAARAHVAFLHGQWLEVRELMSRPLLSIGELQFTPWLVYRESFIGAALHRAQQGDFRGAYAELVRAGEPTPQFGVGREEQVRAADLLFYRWLLAKRSGDDGVAAAVAAHAVQHWPGAKSIEGAYIYRIAAGAGHPSAEKRLAAMGTVDKAPTDHEILDNVSTLHRVMDQCRRNGSTEGWKKLRTHSIYRYRAELEILLG